MSSPTASEPGSERRSRPNRTAVAKQAPPYTVEVGKLSDRYRTHSTYTSFGWAFLNYAIVKVQPGWKKRLVNGRGEVITRQVGH